MKLLSIFTLKSLLKDGVQNRGVIYGIYALAFLPTLFLVFGMFHKKEFYDTLQGKVDCLGIKLERIKEVRKDQSQFFERFQSSDPEYIQNTLEPLSFLSAEREVLNLVLEAHPFETYNPIKKRQSRLEKNILRFKEGIKLKSGRLEESELMQTQPVEMDIQDLKKVLALVEGVDIDSIKGPKERPPLIVKRMTLEKKKLAEREAYQLEMQLIKRGILQ